MQHTIRWTPEKIRQRTDLLGTLVYRRRAPLPPLRYTRLESPYTPPPLAADLDDSAWHVVHPHSYWGDWLSDMALRGSFTVPADWSHTSPIALFLPLGEAGDFDHPEALIYIDGVAYAGADRQHHEIRLDAGYCDGEQHRLLLHGWTGGLWHTGQKTQLYAKECAVVQIDQPTRDLEILSRTALEAAALLHEHAPERARIYTALDDAFKLVDFREPHGDAFYESASHALETLRAGLARAGQPLDVVVHATGHAHIDVAWLWTLGQTRRKSERTFATVLKLMEQYPEYHFTQSQPQLYDYIREDQPQILAQIKQRVAEGRWEIIGGMWIEADCNLTGAESLARQFLLGRSFFREHFGAEAETRVLWLPDVFGYAWALPQLIKQAGLEYFFTIKIGWSQYNRLPYDSFYWQGLDGTRVLTHFSTSRSKDGYASTYNAMANPEETYSTWTNFQQKDIQRDLLMAYGFGDGGGGPTRDMLDRIRILGDMPGMPQLKQSSVKDFFETLERESGAQLPTWNGELYLEYHRGTYTTQARNKRANRYAEFALHDAELLGTLASLHDTSFSYPAAELRKAWELVCLNQFHDIIPGTSIREVYLESAVHYEQIAQAATSARDGAIAALGAQLGGEILLVNPTSFAQTGIVFVETQIGADEHPALADGTLLVCQPTDGGTLLHVAALPALSVVPVVRGASGSLAALGLLSVSESLLENDLVRVEINADGDISRFYDKRHQREVLPAGALANQFQMFEDRPMMWDAWDVDIFFDDKLYLAEPAAAIRVAETGPLRATIVIERQIGISTYTQRISLAVDSAQLDIDTTIDWRERHALLKVAFPVDILAPTATHEIQWGNVERPTHRNTSWDWARFETCAQKWIDLSESDYGVSLLNDCKYGHDVRANVMRISLLRSPTHPDPEADQGQQTFRYSLLPHAGRWGSETYAAAYALNDPLRAFVNPVPRAAVATSTLLRVSRSNVIVETVKPAEDGDGIIVRLYESQRQRGSVTLQCGFGVAAAEHTNIMEEPGSALLVQDGAITLDLHPYEIATIRVRAA